MEAWEKGSPQGGYSRCSTVRNEPFEASDRGWCQRQPDQMDGSALPQRPLCPSRGIPSSQSWLMIHREAPAVGSACHVSSWCGQRGPAALFCHRPGLFHSRTVVCHFQGHPWDQLLGRGKPVRVPGSCQLCGASNATARDRSAARALDIPHGRCTVSVILSSSL